MKRTFADFFAGIGLAELGLRAGGWEPVFANDIDPKKHEMYRANFRKRNHYICADVFDLTASRIPDATLWWASFPCTDVSLAGYRKGLDGPQTGALLGVLGLLREKDGQRPPLVLLENVTGFITSSGGQDFDEAIRELNGIGYACDAFILDAVRFVPQSRPRLFIIGMYDHPFTKGVAEALARRPAALKSPQLTSFMAEDRQLGWRVLDIPAPPTGRPSLPKVIEQLPEDSGYWWSSERVEYLLRQMSGRHRVVANHLMVRPGTHYATVYRRMRHGKSMAELRADGIAGCLRTPRGGSSRQILLAAGGGRIRARFMTPREYARLMGAPRYKLTVNDNQAYFGFGDAVAVPVVKWIAEHVLGQLCEQEITVAEHVAAKTR